MQKIILFNKTGVFNDPLSQTQCLASSDHYYQFKFVYFARFCKLGTHGRMDGQHVWNYWPWLWYGRVDHFSCLPSFRTDFTLSADELFLIRKLSYFWSTRPTTFRNAIRPFVTLHNSPKQTIFQVRIGEVMVLATWIIMTHMPCIEYFDPRGRPQSRLVVINIFTQSVRPKSLNSSSNHCRPAKWITDDYCLVFYIIGVS